MPEALRLIREEMGPDAVILSTRQVKPGKGVFGLLGRPLLEVTAAADVNEPVLPPHEPRAPAPRPARQRSSYIDESELRPDRSPFPHSDEVEPRPSRRTSPYVDAAEPRPAWKPPPYGDEGEPRPSRKPSPYAEAAEPRPRPAADHGIYLALQAEVDSLREELSVLGRRPPAGPQAPNDARVVRDLKSLEEKVDRLLDQTARFDALKLAPGLRKLHGALEARDLEPALTARVVAFLQEKLDRGVFGEAEVFAAFRQLVERTVRVSGSLLAPGAPRRVVALVGPTGVGKTTTVAKLAALHGLQQGRRVGLVTVDTYRIAAVEQLKTYAKIMGVPLRVAVDGAGFESALQESADCELVLVDTAGQSPRDEQSLNELLELFPPGVAIEVHLVLSVTTRAKDLDRILRHYAPAKPSRLLLTKLDETDCHGPLLGLPLASRLPLSYLTTGQSVPDDIEEASSARVAEYLLRGLETVGT